MRSGALSSYTPAAGRSPANLAFSALVFSFLGWAILERWSFMSGAGAGPHMIVTVACAPVLACSLRRFRAACPRHMRARMPLREGLLAGGLGLSLLSGVGALFGCLAGSGSMTPVVLAAGLVSLAPWTRLRVHQQHLFLSLLAVAAGSALAPALARQAPSLMAVLPAAWCLWAAAAALCIALCGEERLRRRRHR